MMLLLLLRSNVTTIAVAVTVFHVVVVNFIITMVFVLCFVDDADIMILLL